METTIEFDALEKSKARTKRLKGSLSRALIESIRLRILEVFPEATRVHVVQHEDNVYRVFGVTKRKKWLAVCEKNVAPTWTSVNLDQDIDLVMRLAWTPRIATHVRKDGTEIHSIALFSYPRTKEVK